MPTPTTNSKLKYRSGRFDTLTEGLDYAARGETGCNFYSSRGELAQSLSYTEIRDRAMALAQRLVNSGLPRGSRMGVVAETTPEFLVFFYGCQYAGILPVPLTVPMNLGGQQSYVQRLHMMLKSSGARSAVASPELIGQLREAAEGLDLAMVGTPDDFYNLPTNGGQLRPFVKDDLCYVQYSSGSTRFPHGVAISQRSIQANSYAIINHGMKIVPGDRCVSWLPLYHDMGLVGFCVTPMLAQLSLDYIATSDFARRPLLWLRIISQNRGTLSFSPTFGYDICLRRMASSNGNGNGNGSRSELDLSSWRIAGIGGDLIRHDVLQRFAETFEDHGFDRKSFLASYGMAEVTLAISFGPLDKVWQVDHIDKAMYAHTGHAVSAKGNGSSDPEATRDFVNCGSPLPGHEIEIRDEAGNDLPDRCVGNIFVKGPSIMAGYFDDPVSTEMVLGEDGWLNTGDLGYTIDGSLVVTGRSKDLIIINGRNIWPQDIEWAVDRLTGLRRGDVAALSVTDEQGLERVVVIVQCRLRDEKARAELRARVAATVYATAGVDCTVVLAPSRSLPLTSSGKLSRSWAKQNYLSGMYRDEDPTSRPPLHAHLDQPLAAAQFAD